MSCTEQRQKYTVYEKGTELPVAVCATSEECARAMCVSVGTFHCYLSPSGKVRENRWLIVKEGKCVELCEPIDTRRKTIGEYMKMCRREKGFTQNKLAELSGVTRDNIRRYEEDKNYPSIMNVICIADALDVSIDELIGRSRK